MSSSHDREEMPFAATVVASWPPRSWVAVLPTSRMPASATRLLHGPAVEVDERGRWFSEAIWTGDFKSADFDRHDEVFGSGGRLRGNEVRFVSSASMLDRLHHIELGGSVFVSNSLPALLAVSGANLDPLDPRGYQRFHTQRLGPGKYDPTVPTDRGDLHIAYLKHVVWRAGRIIEEDRPQPELRFSDFADYYGYLLTTFRALATNMADPDRRAPMRFLGTLSNGYDSTTATVLGRAVGLDRAVSFVEPHERSESAIREVAAALGIHDEPVSRYAYRDHRFPEVPFLSSGSYGYEMQFKGVEAELAGTVLLTGYYGDRAWGIDLAPMPPMARTSQSGISLTEYRLHANFIHLPVPFLAARRIEDLFAISVSDEMKPWRLGNGYDRPIPRRIIESAGVPRNSFAFGKLMSSVTPRSRNDFTAASFDDFMRFLRTHGGSSIIARAKAIDGARGVIHRFGHRLMAWDVKRGSPQQDQTRLFKRLRAYGKEPYLFKYSFGWALERAINDYKGALPRPGTGTERQDDAAHHPVMRS